MHQLKHEYFKCIEQTKKPNSFCTKILKSVKAISKLQCLYFLSAIKIPDSLETVCRRQIVINKDCFQSADNQGPINILYLYANYQIWHKTSYYILVDSLRQIISTTSPCLPLFNFDALKIRKKEIMTWYYDPCILQFI